ncbi:flagellar motor protein MotB [Palleronia sp. KMU-117]|uniref:flagellar motor protein MotB n=1 Tax=Palleronia sp. KMU-117 TaxID=3434108 RepID=UPI003D720C95
MPAQTNAPVIIRRKKIVAGGGHHGGAWKVAYADFVTAMMAFFLLMWLLGATNENQRKGIADFFSPTIPMIRASGGGDGAFGGDSVFSEMTLARNGTGAGQLQPTEARQARGDTGVDAGEEAQTEGEEAATLAAVEAALMGGGGESMVTELLRRHVISRITDEGLIVEVFDTPEASLFEPPSDEPTEVMDILVGAVVEVFAPLPNGIAVEGHVAAVPIVLRNGQVWERSQDRPDRVRQMMLARGLAPDRIERVTGFADRKPVARNPMSERNNRIEIILLRSRI